LKSNLGTTLQNIMHSLNFVREIQQTTTINSAEYRDFAYTDYSYFITVCSCGLA